MKKITVIALTILFSSCNAQKIRTMGKFDIAAFNKNKNHLNRYIDTLDNGTIIEQRESANFYEEIVKLKDSYFEKYRRYYKNGNLQLEGEYLNNDFQKGIWKEYNKKGELLEETDYDKGFEYTWEDLLEYLQKRKVDIKDTDNTIIQDAKNEFEEGS